MKNISRIILCLTVTLLNTVFVQSQEKEISFEESHQQLVAAFAKEYKGKWRINLKYEYFENGKLSSKSETITENDEIADRTQQVRTETSGSRIEKFQVIRIRERYYCRKNNAVWKKYDEWCDNQLVNISGSGDEVSAKYTVENTNLNNQNAKLFRQYIVSSDGKSETYWDYKFWINEDGFILRREIEQGVLKTKTIFYKMTEIREYNAKNIRIVAPIK